MLLSSSPQSFEQETIPVFLITGLLGSGKTTLLLELIRQKPDDETWGIIVNEFGEIDIDAAYLQTHTQNSPAIRIANIKGGCVCCTAGIQLSQAIQQFISKDPVDKIDKLWIEPTGLGHPAGIIDTINLLPDIKLQANLCVITPRQLTPQRWKKSAVMRDLVNLADAILISQIDLASENELDASKKILNSLYPSKAAIYTDYKQANLHQFKNLQALPFKIRESSTSHLSAPLTTLNWQYPAQFIETFMLQIEMNSMQIKAFGIQLNAGVIFNRTQLKTWLQDYSKHFIRAKGLMRTGKEWQLIQWTPQSLKFSDIAWRQDSRIECLLNEHLPIIFETPSPETTLPSSFQEVMTANPFLNTFCSELFSCISKETQNKSK